MKSKYRIKSFKLPNKNDIGLKFAIGCIKGVSNTKLLGIKGIVESHQETEYKKALLQALKKEFDKRHMEWVYDTKTS